MCVKTINYIPNTIGGTIVARIDVLKQHAACQQRGCVMIYSFLLPLLLA